VRQPVSGVLVAMDRVAPARSATVADSDLYLRGSRTLAASWEEYARGASDAAVHRLPTASVAVFPRGPESTVYNNTLLERELAPAERGGALDDMEALYAAAGVTDFTAWVHETDQAMRAELEQRGYRLAESTRAMGMALDDIRLPEPEIELGPAEWSDYVRFLEASGLPSGLLTGTDPRAFHVLTVVAAGETVSAAIAYDFGGDCGIYNVETHEHTRRRGLGTALTALHIRHARVRGCRTATLQSTEMAERLYASVGFRDLGRFLEYAPSPPHAALEHTLTPVTDARTRPYAPPDAPAAAGDQAMERTLDPLARRPPRPALPGRLGA
jgi:ribosomal protein S18 acetylase RimI-like enzyme